MNDILWNQIYEDEDVVGINKPFGLVVNRADSVTGVTLQDLAEENHPEWFEGLGDSDADNLFRERSGMVHRLDKDTSGVMLWAKNPEMMQLLMDEFKNRKVNKTYLALVHGKFSPTTGDINLPIQRSRYNRHKFEVAVGGKQAETSYKVVKKYQYDGKLAKKYQEGFTLMEMHPKTGRTHQIRVHLSYLKHPIVADGLYGSKKRIKLDARWCDRQFLHAYVNEFRHPKQKQLVSIKAELSDDLIKALENLNDADE